MKVIIKTVRAGSHQVDAEPTDSIRAVKSKIEESQGFAAHLQKIIFSGEVLGDDKTLESCGFSEDKFLMLIVNQRNTKNQTPGSVTPSTSNSDPVNVLSPGPNASSLIPAIAPVNTLTVSPAIAGPSNYPGVPPPNSIQTPHPSAPCHSQVKAQIIGVGPGGDQKVLATLEGSEVNDFEELKAMGFPQQATVEAYLLCDKNKEHAASYLLENGSDTHPSSSGSQSTQMSGVDSEKIGQLIAALERPQYDEIERIKALGFSHGSALAAYLACNKDVALAASFLVEHGDSLNLDFNSTPMLGSSPISEIPTTPPSTASVIGTQPTVAPTLPESPNPLVLSPTPSMKSLGKRPLRPDSDSDENRPKKAAKISENSSVVSSSAPPSPFTSPRTQASSVSSVDISSDVIVIDDSEIEENFSGEEKVIIDRLEAMGFPRGAVIEAICVCDRNEERSVEYLYDNGYEV
ncbi:UV excision repair protein rad23 [Stygiomarasmius scandens]|uniref:UV excision repair protein RAD23 n=1 Tax=Marasmiellus scandens TaxID=2682957 RepID=A0ABR1J4I4_9AGAR